MEITKTNTVVLGAYAKSLHQPLHRPPFPSSHRLPHRWSLTSTPRRLISRLLAIMPRPRKEWETQLHSRICELYSVGFGPNRIHEKYHKIPYNTIRSTISQEHQHLNNHSRPQSERPHQLTEEQRAISLDFLQPVHLKYPDLLDEVDHTVEKRSIQNLLDEMGRRKWKQRKSALTITNSCH